MTTPTTAKPVVMTPRAATILNGIIDYLVGDLLANPRVTKLVSWVMVTAAMVFHSKLGLQLSTVLASGGLIGHVASVHKETPPA
jgi:hypothetical protein